MESFEDSENHIVVSWRTVVVLFLIVQSVNLAIDKLGQIADVGWKVMILSNIADQVTRLRYFLRVVFYLLDC